MNEKKRKLILVLLFMITSFPVFNLKNVDGKCKPISYDTEICVCSNVRKTFTVTCNKVKVYISRDMKIGLILDNVYRQRSVQ